MTNKNKKKLNDFARKDYIKVLLSIIIVFVGLITSSFNINLFFDWKYFSSIIIAAMFLFVGDIIQKIIINKTEDVSKITEDYSELVKQYENVKFIKTNNDNILIEEICRFNNKSVVVIDKSNEKKYELPKVVDRNYIKILNSHSTSNIKNRKTVRLDDVVETNNEIQLLLSKNTYFDLAVTNLSCDYEFDNNLTVRNLYEPGPYMTPLSDSKMANRLGFDCFIKTKDDYILFVYRDSKKIMAKNTFSFSFSSSIESLNDEYSYESLCNYINTKIYNNIFCSKVDETIVKTKWLSLYRDIQQCGLPKLLILCEIDKKLKDLLLDNSFSNAIINNKNNIWIKMDTFDRDFFTNNVLFVKSDKNDAKHLLVSNNSISLAQYRHIHSKGFVRSGLRTSPAISGCLILLFNSLYNE